MAETPYKSGKAWCALLLGSLLGCGGDRPQVRTLTSGRQIEVHTRLLEGKDGPILSYAYKTDHLSDESEWAEVVLIAKREAEQAKARELYLLADDNSLLNLITRDRARRCTYERDGNTWRAMRGALNRP